MDPANISNIQYLVIYFWNIPWASENPKTAPKLPGGTQGIHAWDNLLVFGSFGCFPWQGDILTGVFTLAAERRRAQRQMGNAMRHEQIARSCVLLGSCWRPAAAALFSAHTHPLPAISVGASQYTPTNPATSCSDWPISGNFPVAGSNPQGSLSRGSSLDPHYCDFGGTAKFGAPVIALMYFDLGGCSKKKKKKKPKKKLGRDSSSQWCASAEGERISGLDIDSAPV